MANISHFTQTVNGISTTYDIHDANAVDLTNNQTVGGNKEFTGTTTAHDLVPSATDTYNFGSSSAQWKSFNGNNPGALSLPSTATGCVDIKSTVGQYLKDNNTNIYEFTAPFDGWVCAGIVKGSLRIDNTTTNIGSGNENQGWWQCAIIPFMKNNTIQIKINKMDATDDYVTNIMWKVFIYPCQGNV